MQQGLYPNHAGYKQLTTAKDAADSIEPHAKILREQVLNVLKMRSMTADEVAEWLGESILSIRPRLSELKTKELIVDTGIRRKNVSGKKAIVWEGITPELYQSREV